MGQLLTKLPDRLLRLCQNLGWWDGLLHLTAKVVSWLSMGTIRLYKYYFIAQPVRTTPLLPANRGASIQVSRVGPADKIVEQFPRPPDVIQQRFNSKADCLAAWKENALVGYLWLQRGDYMEDEVRCQFAPSPSEHTIWDFDVHVESGQRGGLVFARLWDEANRFMNSIGIQWTVSRISAFNPASINSHTRLGAFPIGHAYFLKIGSWQVTLTSNYPKYIHVSLDGESYPRIVIPVNERKNYYQFRLNK
jgi:hypothetical protein